MVVAVQQAAESAGARGDRTDGPSGQAASESSAMDSMRAFAAVLAGTNFFCVGTRSKAICASRRVCHSTSNLSSHSSGEEIRELMLAGAGSQSFVASRRSMSFATLPPPRPPTGPARAPTNPVVISVNPAVEAHRGLEVCELCSKPITGAVFMALDRAYCCAPAS